MGCGGSKSTVASEPGANGEKKPFVKPAGGMFAHRVAARRAHGPKPPTPPRLSQHEEEVTVAAGQPCPEAQKVPTLQQNAGDADVDDISTQASEPVGDLAAPVFSAEDQATGSDSCPNKSLRRADTSAESALAPQTASEDLSVNKKKLDRANCRGGSLYDPDSQTGVSDSAKLKHSDCRGASLFESDGDAKVKADNTEFRSSTPSNCEEPEAEAPVSCKEGHYIVHKEELPGTFLPGVPYRAAPRSDSADEAEANTPPEIAAWGTIVKGTPYNDEWLLVGNRYLPLKYQGRANVLKLLVEEVSGELGSKGKDVLFTESPPGGTLGLAPWKSRMTCCPAKREASVDEQCFGC